MAYKLRTFTCGGCGAEVQRRAKQGSSVLCWQCGIAAAATAARQMNARSGPYYQRWLDRGGAKGRRRRDPDDPAGPFPAGSSVLSPEVDGGTPPYRFATRRHIRLNRWE